MAPVTFDIIVHGDDFGFFGDDSVEVVQIEATLSRTGMYLSVAPFSCAEQLPRDDVRVVFEDGGDDFISDVNVGAPPRIGDEVQGFGSIARKNYFAPRFGIDEFLNLFARLFVPGGGLFGERINAAMNVGVVVTIVGRRV